MESIALLTYEVDVDRGRMVSGRILKMLMRFMTMMMRSGEGLNDLTMVLTHQARMMSPSLTLVSTRSCHLSFAADYATSLTLTFQNGHYLRSASL